ncbi:MAG: TonB-dependent receptor, partial [Calditrichaeota bacterium]|nr:TonB-dependent receptor [Calditrichota bacterium]
GSTFTQVLILLDGVRFNDPLTGHFNSYIPISISEIERIEVIKGPASAIFGPDAVGGVINIISKLFARQQIEGEDQSADFSILGGENNLIATKGSYFLQDEQFNFSFGAQLNKSDGHSLPSGLRGDFDIKTISGGITFKIDRDWQLIYKGGYDQRDFNAQYYYTASTFDLSREETSAEIHQVMLSRSSESSETQVSYTSKNSTDYFLFNPAFAANNHDMDYSSIQLNHQMQLGNDLRLNVGMQSDNRQIVSNDRGNHDENHFGVYTLAAITVNDDLDLSLALRGDSDDNYDFEFLPQVNFAYHAGKMIWRGGFARTIRAADFTERYVSTNLPAPLGAGRNLGNPDLEAESAWSYEIGTDLYPALSMRLSLTLYHRDAQNVIDYVLTNQSMIPNANNLGTGLNYLYATNVASVKTSGVEAEWSYRYQLMDHSDLNLLVGYVLASTDIADGVLSKYLSNHAKHLISSQVKWNYQRFTMIADGLWKIRESSEFAAAINQRLNSSYAVWNLALDYQLIDHFTAKVQLNNLLDKQYADILGAQMPGRWFMAGIEWRL